MTWRYRLFIALITIFLAQQGVAQAPSGDDAQFQLLEEGLKDKAKAAFGSAIPDQWGRTSIHVTRSFAAGLISDYLRRSQLSITASFPKQNIHIDTIPVTTSHQDLPDCSGSRWPCDSDCGWDLGCMYRKGICEANKKSNMMICEGQKAALQLISDKKLGVVNMGSPEADAEAHLTLTDARITPNFDAITLTAKLAGEGSIRGQVNFTPEPATFVLCLPHSDTLHPPVSVHVDQSPTVTAGIEFKTTPTGVVFSLKPNNFDLSLEFDGNVVGRFIMSNPQLFITCSLPAALGLAYSAISPIRAVNRQIQLPSVSTDILPVRFGIEGLSIELVPIVTDVSLGFQVKTP